MSNWGHAKASVPDAVSTGYQPSLIPIGLSEANTKQWSRPSFISVILLSVLPHAKWVISTTISYTASQTQVISITITLNSDITLSYMGESTHSYLVDIHHNILYAEIILYSLGDIHNNISRLNVKSKSRWCTYRILGGNLWVHKRIIACYSCLSNHIHHCYSQTMSNWFPTTQCK